MLSPKNYSINRAKNYNLFLDVAKVCQSLLLALPFIVLGGNSVLSQEITPNNDGTGTVINRDGNTTNIEGGSLSEDGKNLFHSFEQFGLSQEQIANFMSNPEIRNILGRINGGDPSVINGLLQVTGGNSNLLLMNPAGIIFGSEAQLNVPGDFTATTATGIGFENNAWFNAIGENNYQSLVGTPSQFAFDNGNSGSIINNGKLSLAEGKNLTLLGGNVINTGEIAAAEGSVTISAIPGSSNVKISQPGHLLSLEIEPPRDNEGNVLPFDAKDLPALLTSAGEVDAGLTPNADGSIKINDANKSFVPEANMAIASGAVNVSGTEGGEINVTGNKVGILSGDINAQGTDAGGNVRVGGDYQGGGEIPNATHTIVDDNSTIAVDATGNGDGGSAIVWSDSLTRMTGNINARGGANGGDGGLVEVSGKDLLVFTGTVDAGSDLGQAGELLLDPKNITIGDADSPLATLVNPNPEDVDADNSSDGDAVGFGISVAAVGENVVVGAPNYNSSETKNAGQAFLFDSNGNALRTYDNPNPVEGGFFGWSVAAAGDNEFLVGASRNTSNEVQQAGQVFLFDTENTDPIRTYDNPNSDARFDFTFGGTIPGTDHNFGVSVAAVGGDRILVGAPGHTSGGIERAGQAFSIDRNDASLIQTYDNPNPSEAADAKGAGNAFGISVVGVEDNLLIGASGNSFDDFTRAGQAFLFSQDSNELIQSFNNPNPTNSGRFGRSVAGVEDNLLIGAPGNDSSGQAFLFAQDGTQIQSFDNPVATINGGFGDSIAVSSDNVLIIGAPGNSSDGVSSAGQVFLLNADGTAASDLLENPEPVTDPEADTGGKFGNAVASTNDGTVIVGADGNTAINDAGEEVENAGQVFRSRRDVNFGEIEDINENVSFATNSGDSVNLFPETITNVTNTGTDVTLQANNDLIVDTEQNIITNADGEGGNITFQAGRNVSINSNIVTDNGNLNITANETTENGVVAEFRDPGTGSIFVADNVTLDAGTGDINLNVNAGEGARGNISVDTMIGSNLSLITGDGTVNVDGNISAVDGNPAANINVAGDEINFNGGDDSIVADNLTLQAGTTEQNINIGNDSDAIGALDLETSDITALNITPGEGEGDDASGVITIGNSESTGTVTLSDSVADGGDNPFENPVNIVGGDTLVSPNGDFTWDIAAGNLNDVFANGLTYNNIENYRGGEGNNTFVLGDTAVGSVDGGEGSNTLIGNDGDNTYRIDDVDAGTINEETNFDNIQNLTAGDGNDTFAFAGNTAQVTGNVDGGGGTNNLDYDEYTGLGDDEFVFDPDSGQATGINGTVSSVEEALNIPDGEIDTPDEENTPNAVPPEIEDDLPRVVTPRRDEQTARETESEIPATIGNLAFERGANDRNNGTTILPLIDSDFTQGYENYYSRSDSSGRRSSQDGLNINLPQVKDNLRSVEEATGAKPALVYVAFFPAGVDAIQGRNSNILPQADDRLELITITEDGQPIRTQIKNVTRADVDKVARRFSQSIFDQQPEEFFLPPAQQLYKWLIEPIQEQLDTEEISNLVFLMDRGLRTVPVAALHDGEQYLVQKYSVGLMPSLSLTDTRYQSIKDLGLLAMGSENFPADPALFPLPAVPVEVDIITQQLWSGGTSFLDEEFTIDNLKKTQTSNPFGILHLANHAEFTPGTPNNSYIQFGDRKLELDKVRELGLSNPQVELMVLSACKTAFGDPDAEYGFAGLAHQAGVKSALGSLWYVNDQGTLSIMSKFYQELKDAPIKAEALRRAQVAMIEETVRLEKGKLIAGTQTFELPEDIEAVDMTHPRYWSSFTIVGNPW